MSAILLSGSGRPQVQARAASYTLSGSPDGTGAFNVDDDLDVYLNGVLVYSDNTPPNTPSTRPPIALTADVGDSLRFVVRDTYGDCTTLTTIFLVDAAGRSTVADPGFSLGCGRPPGNLGISHDYSFVIPDLSITPVAEAVADIRVGTASSNPRDMAVFQNALYFSANDGTTGRELWRLGTSGPPVRVADINPGLDSSSPQQLTVAGDTLYFVATTPTEGQELWRYDGITTPALVVDLTPGPVGSDLEFLTAFGNQLVFEGSNGVIGEELFSFDGTTLTPHNLFPDDPSCAPFCDSDPESLTVHNGMLYFTALHQTAGMELWQFDGTSTPTLLVDLGPGSTGPQGITGLGNTLVFGAFDFGQYRLFSYTLGTGGRKISDIVVNDTRFTRGTRFAAFQNRVALAGGDFSGGEELWTTDGTATGTRLPLDLNPGPTPSRPRWLIPLNGELYFGATDAAAGEELRAFNGAGIRLVADINPGALGSSFNKPATLGPFLVFEAHGADGRLQPWVTTGTDLMTTVARKADGTLINPTGDAIDDPTFTFFNGALYFAGNDGVRGSELWRLTLDTATPTTTTLASSLNPSIAGDQVTLTASVTGAGAPPTGTVTFFDGGTPIGTVGLTSGTASLDISTLARGSHTLTASYSGDVANAVSTSGPLVQLVNGQPTTTLLTSSENPSAVGSLVMFRAAVSGGAVGGTVTFRDGAIELNTVPLAAGIANFTTAALSIGSHSVTATYNGDAVYASSTSNTVVQVVDDVGGTPTSTTLTSSPNPSVVEQFVTLTATVTGQGVPTGSVIFRNGAVDLGPPVPLVGGTAVLNTASLAAGTHQLTASYSGDLANDPSVSSPSAHTVNRASQVVGLFSSKNPSKTGDSVTFTATLNADATGTITFLDNSVSLGSSAVVGGQTTLAVSTLAIGVHPIVARYDGDAKYLPVDSAPVNQTVNPLNSAPLVAAIADVTVRWGQAINFTASATDIDGDPVTFTLPNPPGGASITPGGQFTWTPTSTQTGTYPLTVEASDGSLVGTRSFTITVQPHVTATALLLPFEAAPGPVELRAELRDLTEGTPLANQNVLFELGTQSVLAITDAAGAARATLQLAQPGGQVAYTASFSGSPAYLSSTQSATFVINLPPVIVPTPPQQITWGRTLTFPFAVSDPEGVPLNITLLNAPGFQLNLTTISWTPTAADTGQTTIVLRVSDGVSVVTSPIVIDVLPHTTAISMGGPAVYGRGPIEILATLTDSEFGLPLAGRPLSIRLGTASTPGTTDAAGTAIGRLDLQQPAGPVSSGASFAGELAYAPSTGSRPFTIIEDSDGDGLPDEWETSGVTIDGVYLDLPAMGANPLRTDLFVEVDWMLREPVCAFVFCYGSVPPQPAALAAVIAAYAAAPVANPDGSTGISLHIDAGPDSVMDPLTGARWGTRSHAGEVPYVQALGVFTASDYDWSAFDGYKQTYFEAVRRPVFHYAIYVDQIGDNLLRPLTGIARDIPSSDFIISYTAWLSTTQEAGLFAHELGHNLMLRHGGGDNINNKPNYESVLNYLWTFLGVPPDGRPDYSSDALAAVDEAVTGDANGDGTVSLLLGYDDWPNLNFGGQGIGDLFAPPPPRSTPVDDWDIEDLRRRGAWARPGDGTIDFRGPLLIVADSGLRSFRVIVRNISDIDASYQFAIESPGLPAPLTGVTFVAANQLVQLDVPFDTAGLVAGRYPVRITLGNSGGDLLHEQHATIDVLDVSTADGRATAAAVLAALNDLPDDAPIDADVVAGMIDMLDDVLVSWEAVAVVTGQTAFSARYAIADPQISGTLGLIRAQSRPGDPVFLLELVRAGSLAAGRVRMRTPSGAIFEAPVAGRWIAATRTFEGKWAISRQSGSISVRLQSP